MRSWLRELHLSMLLTRFVTHINRSYLLTLVTLLTYILICQSLITCYLSLSFRNLSVHLIAVFVRVYTSVVDLSSFIDSQLMYQYILLYDFLYSRGGFCCGLLGLDCSSAERKLRDSRCSSQTVLQVPCAGVLPCWKIKLLSVTLIMFVHTVSCFVKRLCRCDVFLWPCFMCSFAKQHTVLSEKVLGWGWNIVKSVFYCLHS